mmetsp:Transcript_6911/g.20742  ORF Transcript_6911/g.20742 Transcript_6911/m.20742 type:complete len:103 (-) Transcript_6911:169-477(-)
MTSGEENKSTVATANGNAGDASSRITTWKLPDGIEDHIESGLIKSAVGATVGGVVGLVLFRSGKGWRAASVAMGVGVAVGSTVERAREGSVPKNLFGSSSLF